MMGMRILKIASLMRMHAENEDSASEPSPALPVHHHQATIDDLETCLLHSLHTDRSTRQLEGML